MPPILDRFRSSTLGWLYGSIAGWGTILLALAGLAGMVLAGGDVLKVPPAAPLLLTLAAVVILLARWIGNLAASYEVTGDRLILYRGIVNKSIDEIELYRIKDIRLTFSIVNQLAGIGTLTIGSSDESTRAAPLVIRDAPQARALRERLRELVNAARLSRGVRELDIVPEQA